MFYFSLDYHFSIRIPFLYSTFLQVHMHRFQVTVLYFLPLFVASDSDDILKSVSSIFISACKVVNHRSHKLSGKSLSVCA